MAEALTIRVVRNPAWVATDRLEVEVGGVVQPERVAPWGDERSRMGFGQADARRSLFGSHPTEGFGGGAFGAGGYGAGAGLVEHRTLRRFVAGDYAVRLRAVDAVGNASAWSAAATIRHRPRPARPRGMSVAENVLSWAWSDPPPEGERP